jgi:hypothetical protein
MAAKKKSASRKSAPKKVAKSAAQPAKRPVPAALPPEVIELDRRIAILRSNLRELTEQAAASSGASTEELLSDRIADREAQLRLLIKQRDERAKR